MPTVNPRITVTLSPPLAACLRELSGLTGNSQSALIGELLNDSLPVFQRMTELLRAAEKAKAEGLDVRRQVNESLRDVQARLEAQLGLQLDSVAEVGGSLLADLEKVPRRSSGAAADPTARGAVGGAGAEAPRSGATPMSNRGVTPQRKTRNRVVLPAGQGR